MKKSILSLALLTFLGGLASFTAHAAVLTYSANFLTSVTLQTNGASLYFDAPTVSTNIPAFDGNLGSLAEVQVNWTYGLNYSVVADGGGGSLGYGMGGSLYIYGFNTNGSGFGGGSGIDPNNTNAGSPSSSVGIDLNSSSTLWNSVSGDSPFSVSFGSDTSNYFGYTGVASGTVSTFRDLTVSFLYTPVPEPWTYALLSLGVLALVLAARRRGSQRSHG